jgi:protein O-mannosyl-transferase
VRAAAIVGILVIGPATRPLASWPNRDDRSMARRKYRPGQGERQSAPRQPSAGRQGRPGLSQRSATAWFVEHKDWLFAAALVAAIFLAYQPAWHGGLVWDDATHVPWPKLRTLEGLKNIWFKIGTTQQYYPLLFSAFWLEHTLWGDSTLGYHLINILFHATSALLVAIILRRLAVPGAYLAAAIFALHPMQVESVAWITEQKNTLSGVFYLSAILVYLRFDRTRRRGPYLAAMGLFALALLSKTVTVTLPAALLVIFWWQRGTLSWRRDVLPLAPFFVMSAAIGALTTVVERDLGAQGEIFALSIVDRFLVAGRVIWFYLGKLAWPANLIFIYPRWEIDSRVWWQYLFPAAALLLLGALWRLRRQWRGPLAGLLFFAGTLAPVLGFFNVYMYVYSFVTDHFQYLACLGAITVVSACVALLLERANSWQRPAGHAACLALLGLLAVLTWRQSRMYDNIELLYRTTFERNPDCRMAHNNLGNVFVAQGRFDEAIEQYREALKIAPDDASANYNIACVLAGRGQTNEAIAHYRRALKSSPNYADAHNDLATVLLDAGQIDEAMDHLDKALKTRPDNADAHNNLGRALAGRGRVDEAIAQYREALRLNPRLPQAHNNLATALAGRGQADEAVAEYQEALRIRQSFVEARYNYANLLARLGQIDEAMVQFRAALDLAARQGNAAIAQLIRAKIELYESGTPREPRNPVAP